MLIGCLYCIQKHGSGCPLWAGGADSSDRIFHLKFQMDYYILWNRVWLMGAPAKWESMPWCVASRDPKCLTIAQVRRHGCMMSIPATERYHLSFRLQMYGLFIMSLWIPFNIFSGSISLPGAGSNSCSMMLQKRWPFSGWCYFQHLARSYWKKWHKLSPTLYGRRKEWGWYNCADPKMSRLFSLQECLQAKTCFGRVKDILPMCHSYPCPRVYLAGFCSLIGASLRVQLSEEFARHETCKFWGGNIIIRANSGD